MRIAAAREFAWHVRVVVGCNVSATFEAGNIEEPRLGAVRGRPQIAAARNFRTYEPRSLVLQDTGRICIQLQIPGRVIIDGLAGLRIDALGPGDFGDILAHVEKLAGGAIEAVIESVTARMRDDL